MDIDIRPVLDEDLEALIQLFKEFALFQKTPNKMTITAEQLRQDQDDFNCFVAIRDDVIVGYITYFAAYSSWSGKSMYVDDLYVTPQFRNQHIGKALLEVVIKHAASQNCKKVKWQVSKWNTNAQEFYLHLGAQIDDTEINCEFTLS